MIVAMILPDFSHIFHQSSKDHAKGHPPIPSEYAQWPVEWRTTYYKDYPRLSKMVLPHAQFSGDLCGVISRRNSQRDFSRQPISLVELSILLEYSCGLTGMLTEGRRRRAQPSGGGCFPIEAYSLVFRSHADLPSGVYHYNVKDHALDVLWQREFEHKEIDNFFTYPWVADASIAVILTSVFWRTQQKYGERGYRYAMLEAGHIGQNLYLLSETLGLKCCGLGGTRDEKIERLLLDIDGVTESIMYGLAIGK